MLEARRIRDVSVAGVNVAMGAGALVSCLRFQDGLALDPGAAKVLGLVAVYGGLAFAGWAAAHAKGAIGGLILPRLDEVVTTGPYRLVRHPVYVGTTVAMIGVALVTRSIVGLLVLLLLFLPSEIHRARREERALEARFGHAWAAYRARTPPSLPFVGGRVRDRSRRTRPKRGRGVGSPDPSGTSADPLAPGQATHMGTDTGVER